MDSSSLRSDLLDGFLRAGGGKVKWWHAALFLAGVTVAERLITGRRAQRETKEVYEEENKPVWSPPAWAFGPAWGVNSLALTWAGQRLLNAPAELPNRKALIGLQGLHWLIYTTFSNVYFKQKSPVLAAAWTQGDALVALASYLLARKSDQKLSYAYLPLLAWTGFASTIAWYQALYNRDEFLGTAAPLKLNGTAKALLKE